MQQTGRERPVFELMGNGVFFQLDCILQSFTKFGGRTVPHVFQIWQAQMCDICKATATGSKSLQPRECDPKRGEGSCTQTWPTLEGEACPEGQPKTTIFADLARM